MPFSSLFWPFLGTKFHYQTFHVVTLSYVFIRYTTKIFNSLIFSIHKEKDERFILDDEINLPINTQKNDLKLRLKKISSILKNLKEKK